MELPEGLKSQQKNPHLFKIVLLVCVTALLITCTVVVALVITQQNNKREEDVTKAFITTDGNGKSQTENVTYKPLDNVITLATASGDKIIHDYNKRITVTSLISGAKKMCVLYPLDSLPSDPEELKRGVESTDRKVFYQDAAQTDHVEQGWIVANNPVSDRDFLSKVAQDACADLPIYWAKPDTGVSDGRTNGTRTKREVFVCRLTLTSRTLVYNRLDGRWYIVTSTYYYYYLCDENNMPITTTNATVTTTGNNWKDRP